MHLVPCGLAQSLQRQWEVRIGHFCSTGIVENILRSGMQDFLPSTLLLIPQLQVSNLLCLFSGGTTGLW